MAIRFYDECPWWAEDVNARFPSLFAQLNSVGYRLQTISLSGDPENPDVAAVWMFDEDAPSQQLDLFDQPAEKVVQANKDRARLFGVGASHVAGIRKSDGSTRFAVVWERFFPLLPGAQPPEVIIRTSFETPEMSDLNSVCYDSSGSRYARSIDVVEKGSNDFFPLFIATLWPHGERRFGWMVADLLASDIHQGDGLERGPMTTALAVGYFPWMIVPYRPEPGSDFDERRVLTLWRDVLFTPWTAEPFARSAHREREIRCHAARSRLSFDTDFTERIGKDEETLAVAVNGRPGFELYAAIYVPRGAEPLQRRLFLNGIGNGQNAEVAPERVPASLPGEASGELRRILPSELRSMTELGAPFPGVHRETDTSTDLGRAPQGSGLRAEWIGALQARSDLRSSGTIARGGTPGGGGGPGPGTDRGPSLGRSPGLGRTERDGGGLSTGPDWQAEEKPAPLGSKYHPIDEVMIGAMAETGARVGFVGVLRNGDGAYFRVVTRAEEGYPIAGPDDRVRWGSCSKALMATVLATHYLRADAPRLDSSFATELGISRPGEPDFHAVTIRQALGHRTGISQLGVTSELIYSASHNQDPAPAFANRVLAPGDMRLAFQDWPDTLVTDPSHAYDYNNYVYVALCELWGRLYGEGYNDYANAVKRMLPAELQSLTSVLTGAGYAKTRANGEVTYHTSRPYVVPAPYDSPPWGDDEMILSAYSMNPRFGAGAGFWALSVKDMARVMRQLTRRGDNELWPVHVEKLAIRNGDLGWMGFNQAFREKTELITGVEHPVLFHNGLFDGANSTISHLFRGPLDSLDVVAAFNTDRVPGLGGSFQRLLNEAAQEAELLGLWSPIDLLGIHFDL